MTRHIRLREYDPNLEVKARPTDEYLATCDQSLQDKEYIFRTDENGFIRTGLSDNHVDSRLILHLGDSVVENYWVEEHDRSSAALERYLRNNGVHASVLNAGKTGTTTVQSLNYLINKCMNLSLSGVIITTSIMDDMVYYDNGSLWVEIVEHNSSFTQTRYPRPKVELDDRIRALGLLHAICQECSLPFWVTTWGFDARAPCCAGLKLSGDAARQWLDRMTQANEATRQFAKLRGCGLIDLAQCLCGRDELFYDGLHPNALGCAAVGEATGKILVEHFRPKTTSFSHTFRRVFNRLVHKKE